MIKFQLKYFLLTMALLLTEAAIALFSNDAIIRPYGGDFLVVILIYCFIKSFVEMPVKATAIGVLLYAYLIEISQYFHFIDVIGLGNSKLSRIILGTSFSWLDMLMYTLGILLVVLLDNGFHLKKTVMEGIYDRFC